MIIDETPSMENVVIRGLSVEKNQAKVTITGVPDRPGAAAKVFNALAEARVIIDMIVQNVSAHGTTDISFTLNQADLPAAEAALRPVVDAVGAAKIDGARRASPNSAWWASGCARIRAWRRDFSIAWRAAASTSR